MSNKIQASLIRKRACLLLAPLTAMLTSSCIVTPDMTDEILHDWKSHVNAARAFIKKKDFLEAEKEYESASKILNQQAELQVFDALTAREQGLLYLLENKDDKALFEFKRAAKIFTDQEEQDPEACGIYTKQNFEVLYHRGLLERKNNNNKAAIQCFHDALKIDSNCEGSEQVKDQLAALEISEGIKQVIPSEISRKVRSIALDSSTTGKIKVKDVIAISRDLASEGNLRVARQYLDALLALANRNKDYVAESVGTFESIKFDYEFESYDSAEKQCDEAIKLAPVNEAYAALIHGYMSGKFFILMRRGRMEDADKVFSQALQLASSERLKHKLVRIIDVFALIDFSKKHYRTAELGLKRVLQVLENCQAKPAFPSIAIDYAKVLLAQDKDAEARSYLLEALNLAERKEDKCNANLLLTDLSLKQGKQAEARKYAEAARASYYDLTSLAQVRYTLGKVAMAKKDYNGVERELSEALGLIHEVEKTQPSKVLSELQQKCKDLKEEIEGK